MVFNRQFSEESYTKCSELSKTKQKIFTCEEIEGRKPRMRIGSIQQNLKHVDSAIVQFSSSTDLTRYDKADLISLKDGRLSQQPPACYYDRNIIRLNIFKYKTQHTHEMEAQMKEFREKLQNLAVTSWDSNLLHMLKNYHNALLNPLYQSNGYSGNHSNQMQQPTFPIFSNQTTQMQQKFQSPRQVSFSDKQQAVLDKIPSYDRNMNFFDNITTTATMRPPRMGVNSYSNHNNSNSFNKQRTVQNNNLRKPNSCASEHSNSFSSSVGYFSGNDTKSSCEEPMFEKPSKSEKRMSIFDQLNNANKKIESNFTKLNTPTEREDQEKEPEWFNVPASLEDFIDLHGFSDEDEGHSETKVSNESPESKKSVESSSKSFQEFSQNRYNSSPNSSFSRYNNSNNSSYGHVNHNNRNPSSYKQPNHQNQYANNNNSQRFRNPLHFNNKPASRPPSQPFMNPFFDAWRNGKFPNHQNVSFTDLMEQQQKFPKNIPSSAIHMSEIENRMMQQQNLNGMNQFRPPPKAVPNLFQNMANNMGIPASEHQTNTGNNLGYPQQMNLGVPPLNRDGFQAPTQEQLQQFTSQIMRNAILRKNQQQYHDENNFQK